MQYKLSQERTDPWDSDVKNKDRGIEFSHIYF